MSLGLEEGIEVPEGRLNELVRGHFLEAHLHEDLTELVTDLEKRMEITSLEFFT